MSFAPEVDKDWEDWDFLVTGLIKEGIWVTLDYPVELHEDVLEYGFIEYDNFIPMISIKLPYINQLNYNACIKLDDKDFKATNPGVWVLPVNELLQRDKFTDWSKYTKDEIID